MAKFDGKFLTGIIGDAVYKKCGNKQFVTAKSRLTKKQQTENTHRTASQFGLTSSLSADLRKNLKNVVTDFHDSTMVYRLKTLVQQCMRQAMDPQTEAYQLTTNTFERLNGFEFNTDSPVTNTFHVQPVHRISKNILSISLPEMRVSEQLKFPKKATSCLLNVAVGMYDLDNGFKTICPIQSIEISNDKKHDIMPKRKLTFAIEPGCLCISMFSFQFIQNTFSGNQLMNSKKFNPASVLKAVIADGAADQYKTGQWQPMTFRQLA